MKGRKLVQWCCSICMGALALVSCQVERPKTVMSDAQMEAVLYDYHIARAMGDEVPYDESYKRVLYVESVFKKHGITQADFDTSMVWFARNPEVLSKIYEKVNDRLRAERDHVNSLIAIRDNKPEKSLPGDSIDVWMWQHIYQLTGMPLDNKVAFMLPADSNFYDRDTLQWNVRFRFGERVDTFHVPVMALQLLYKNDSLVGRVDKIKSSGIHTISLSADTLGPIKEIRGFIYYPLQQTGMPLLLDRISLMRYHATDSLSCVSDTVSSAEHIEPEMVPEKKTVSNKNVEVRQQPVQRRENLRLRKEVQNQERMPLLPQSSKSEK